MLSRIQDVIGVISGLVLLYAFLPYWKAIKAGEIQPKKATWFVWVVGDAIGFIGQLADHTATIILGAAVFCAAYTFYLSLERGESGWTVTDKICLALSGTALMMWGVMHFVHSQHAPDYAIAFSMLSLIIGAWPTWKSVWIDPTSEDEKAWKIFVASSALALFAIKKGTFADIVVPSTFFFIDSLVLGIILARKRVLEGRDRKYLNSFVARH